MSARLLGGYNKVFKLTFQYFKHCVKKSIWKLTQQSLKVPTWSITDDLHELTFTYNGELCKVLLQINNKVPLKVTCLDGLDVTQEVLPYLKVAPVKFTSEVYGEPFHEHLLT